MVDSEWYSSRDGREIWSAMGHRVGNGGCRRHGGEADFPGVFLSFQSYLRRAWRDTWSVQSADGRKGGARLYAASRNARRSRVRRIIESEHVRGSNGGEIRRWPDEPLDRPSWSSHLHDRDYATAKSTFRHDNSLCHDPCSPICQRNRVP